jgi:tetratricopeptide (TPR) repeat protein
LIVGGPDGIVVFNLANVLYALGMKQEASERFRQALEIDPHHGGAWNNLGIVLSDLHRAEEAIAALERAVALHFHDAHYNLADLLENIGRRSAAREHWREVARLEPESAHGKYARRKLG